MPVSTRGSVANSLIAYCVGITTVDPIEHDLLFERFLSPFRRNPPDIDLDFCSRRRDRVLAYVRDTYGADHVALVATVSTMRPKSAVREAAKAYGLSDEAIARLAKAAPSRWHPDPNRRSSHSLEDLAQETADPTERQALLDAVGLVGQPDHLSVHPGAVVITPGPLTDVTPVQWTAKGFLISQYDHKDIEAIGLPKIDLLGIRALTVLADAAELVRKHHEPAFRLDAIPLDDPATADALQAGETIGVFQCDSAGAQRTLRQLQARTVQGSGHRQRLLQAGPGAGRHGSGLRAPLPGRGAGPLPASGAGADPGPHQGGVDLPGADPAHRGGDRRAELGAGRSSAARHEPFWPRRDGVHALGLHRRLHSRAARRPRLHGATGRDAVGAGAALRRLRLQPGPRHCLRRCQLPLGLPEAHFPACFFAARLADWGGFHHPAVYIAEAAPAGHQRPSAARQSQRAEVYAGDGAWGLGTGDWGRKGEEGTEGKEGNNGKQRGKRN